MRNLLYPDSNDEEEMQEHKLLMSNIRQYNSLFAFASIHTKLQFPDNSRSTNHSRGRGFVYKIQGGMYYRVPPLNVSEGRERETAQFYILDSDEAKQQRMEITGNCLNETVRY